jgi:hypothetical protein
LRFVDFAQVAAAGARCVLRSGVPLTLSHPAAVLQLRRLPFLGALPLAPMVIASMVPDLPMFVPGRGGYGLTHSMLGVPTVDVLVALLLLVAWDLLLRDALVDLSPGVVRDRFPRRARLSRGAWLLAPVSALLGALTHVAWDAFTHPGRWGVAQVEWLQVDHAGLPGHRWAQYVSGVLGLVLVVAAVAHHVRARPSRGRTSPRLLPAATLPCLAGVVGLTAVAVAASGIDQGLHSMAFHAVVVSIQVAVVALAALCLVWGALEVLRRVRARAGSTPDKHVPGRC